MAISSGASEGRAAAEALIDGLLTGSRSTRTWKALAVRWIRCGPRNHRLTSVLNKLERKGFMHRTRCEDDRRKHRLSMTAHGRALKSRLLRIGAAIKQTALVDIDPQDAALAANLLEKVIANPEKQ
jgi:DNA-binding HxlR family transcriptional regulator